MKDLVKTIAQALVNNPERVQVTEVHGSTMTVIELKVAKEDMGQVIGKKGRNAEAIRTILEASAKKLRKRFVLEIIDPV